ncbi:MAG: isoprenoid biosynthesis protein ElbB [Marinilabiliales bacterium]|nr:MAG: isoprenoid biosynthesis protein ElbB [Marinilabiliales bacterium]
MKKVAVILSGCGVYDGSEIHEATLAMLALSKNEVEYECFAPDKEQYHVVNHLTGEATQEKRNVLVESARIARGTIKALNDIDINEFDGLVMTGGFGAAKNLSDYAIVGENFTVDEDVAQVIRDFHAAKKPIAALCIAPVVVAKVLGGRVTIGNDKATAAVINGVGAKHVDKEYNEVAVDEVNKIVTNPCYMLADSIYQVSLGAEAAIAAMLGLMK